MNFLALICLSGLFLVPTKPSLITPNLHHSHPHPNISAIYSPFELFQSEEDVSFFIKQSHRESARLLRPYHYRRFALPNGQYRLHCQMKFNWLRPDDPNWVSTYAPATNLMAVTFTGEHKFSISAQNRTQNLVCYLVDAANKEEASCLLQRMKQHPEIFPIVERLERIYQPQNASVENQNGTSRNPQYHHKPLTGIYCSKAQFSPSSNSPTHLKLFLYLLLFPITGFFILLLLYNQTLQHFCIHICIPSSCLRFYRNRYGNEYSQVFYIKQVDEQV